MNDQIMKATYEALLSVTNIRFFETERGYQGEFVSHLRNNLFQRGIVNDHVILEEEYQKQYVHNTHLRPDIILHIPREASGAIPQENNFAVWALKLRATPKKARDDLEKLETMFTQLNYPLGIFINISANRTLLNLYHGEYAERIVGFAVKKENESIAIWQSLISNGVVITDRLT